MHQHNLDQSYCKALQAEIKVLQNNGHDRYNSNNELSNHVTT